MEANYLCFYRTDVVYQREDEFDFDKLYGKLLPSEQADKATELGEALLYGGATEEAEYWFEKGTSLFGSPE